MAFTLTWRKKGLRSLSRLQKREEESPKIGYFRGRWDDSARDVVHQSWLHVLTQSGSNQSSTIETYREAVRRVEDQARAIYSQNPEDPLPRTEDFVQTMIEHGCFVLQVALCSLGGSKPLGYDSRDPIFGEEWNKSKIRNWVTLIFGIRMQLPLVILQEFMKLSFFQRVLNSKKWKRPKDLPRMTLFDFLVNPSLNGNVNGGDVKIVKKLLTYFNGGGNLQQKPPTLLHALWFLMTGPKSKQNRDIKLEEDDNGDENSSWFTVRSATEMQQAGIIFKNNNGLGINGIQFKKRMLNAILCLPSISIEPNSTKSLFESLILYEEEILDMKLEVCGYLKFMRELIRSPNDVKILAMQGIIHADPKQEEELRGMLEKLHLPEVGNDHNLGVVRHKIRVYVKPNGWELVTRLLSATVILTLLQTIYTVLGYYKSNDKK